MIQHDMFGRYVFYLFVLRLGNERLGQCFLVLNGGDFEFWLQFPAINMLPVRNSYLAILEFLSTCTKSFTIELDNASCAEHRAIKS